MSRLASSGGNSFGFVKSAETLASRALTSGSGLRGLDERKNRSFPVVRGRARDDRRGRGRLRRELKLARRGITPETFTIWVDGNNMLRKVATTAAGTGLTESTVMTITSINQPGSIAIPPASQTAPLPDGALG